MANNDVVASVWGESSVVFPRDGSEATQARLFAVLAQLVARASRHGFDRRFRKAEPPRVRTVDADRFNRLVEVVDAVKDGTWRGTALPKRAVLWEVTLTGNPRLDPPPPENLHWITGASVGVGGDFVVGDGSDGRLFRLYESDEEVANDELPFASVVTGTGLSQSEVAKPWRKGSWGIGSAAFGVFLLGAAMATWTGSSMSDARNVLVSNDPKMQADLLEEVTKVCMADHKVLPSAKPSALCSKLPGDGTPQDKILEALDPTNIAAVLTDARTCPAAPGREGYQAIWRGAIQVAAKHDASTSLLKMAHEFSDDLTGARSVAGSVSIVVPFLLLVAGIAGLVIALGLGTKQRVAGVWIDARNRVSLARAQVTLWTIVALAGFAAISLFNIGFSGIVGPAAAAAGASSSLDIATFAAFPLIPASVAAALGIAVASPMISALILPSKENGLAIRGEQADAARRGVPFFGAESMGLDKRSSPMLASIADVFMGEEVANSDTVDVSRLQGVVITVTLVLGFFSILIAMMTVAPEKLLGAATAIFPSLPELGPSFTSLLFVSHATYLVSKAHDATSPNPGDGSDK